MTNHTEAATVAAQLASRIESARKEQARSVAWLAEKAGFAYKTLRTRLYGLPEKFSISELSAIANALDVSVEWLVSGEEAQQAEEKAAA